MKKDPRDCPVTSFQLWLKRSQQSLEVGTLGAWLLPPTQQKKQCFIYWASYKLSFLSFEKTSFQERLRNPWPTWFNLPPIAAALSQHLKPTGQLFENFMVWELSTQPADLPRDSCEEQQFCPSLHWGPATSHSPRWASFCPPQLEPPTFLSHSLSCWCMK